MADDKKALVATPVARDRAIEQLQDHYARNNLEVEDFERLVELAENARTDAELVKLFEGLPSLPPPNTALEKVGVTETEVAGRVTTTVKATLGSVSRRGRWRVPKRVVVRAVLGSVDIDLSEVELQSGETTIEVRAILGSITLIVPEGLNVECEGAALLGSFDHLVQGAASKRDKRVVRIIGKATLGSVDVIVKKRTGLLQDIQNTVRGLLGP